MASILFYFIPTQSELTYYKLAYEAPAVLTD